MSTWLFIFAIGFFLVAMAGYAVTLIKHKKPLSFFDLKPLAKAGDRVAGVAYVTWGAAIVFVLLFAMVLLMRY